MSDPTRAAHLVADDTLASRSLTYSLDDLAHKVHDLERNDTLPGYDQIGARNHEDDDDDDQALADEIAWQQRQPPSHQHQHQHQHQHHPISQTRRRTLSDAQDQSLSSHSIIPPGTGSHRRGARARSSSPVEASRLRVLWWRRAAINVLFIAAWYLFSSAISVYNKWMFSEEHYNFPYPLFVTSFHMLVQWCLSALTLSIFKNLRSEQRPAARDYGGKVLPCGVASGLDIGLSNLSLRSITLSFYTMCKSSGLAFVLLFAFLFKLEQPSWRLVGIICIITGGVVLMVSSETQFDLAGMIEVLAASAMGGLRWSLVQILLDKESLGMSNPIATLYWLAPIMGVTLAICSMIFDGWGNVFGNEAFFGSLGKIMQTLLAILFPGFLAFAMNITEFGLIQRTSVVTLSVAGIFKEVAVIFLSMFIFHDQLTPINVSGLVVTLFGIATYNYFKYKQFTDDPSSAKGHGHGGHAARSTSMVNDGHHASSRDEEHGVAGEDVMLLSPRERDAAQTLGATNASAIYLDSLPNELTRGSHHTLGSHSSSSSSPSSSRSSISLPSQSRNVIDGSLHLHRMTHASKAHEAKEAAIPHLDERIHQGNEELFALEKEEREIERLLDLDASGQQPKAREEGRDGLLEPEGSQR